MKTKQENEEKGAKSADFYGAMDGATKFVKMMLLQESHWSYQYCRWLNCGNAHEESFQETQTYALLTIGDGLVCQIPALMISTATSFVVTRSASDTEISQELLGQLFRNHIVMYIAAFVSFLLSFFLAKIPFASDCFIYIYWILIIQTAEASCNRRGRTEIQAEEIRKPENVMSLLQIDPIEWDLDMP